MTDEAMFAARGDVDRLTTEAIVELHVMGDALAARQDRDLRRLVFMLGPLLVAAGATVVLLAWSVS